MSRKPDAPPHRRWKRDGNSKFLIDRATDAATKLSSGEALNRAEAAWLADLLERVLSDEDVRADFWETADGAPPRSEHRNFWIAVDFADRDAHKEKRVARTVAAAWGFDGPNGDAQVRRIAKANISAIAELQPMPRDKLRRAIARHIAMEKRTKTRRT